MKNYPSILIPILFAFISCNTNASKPIDLPANGKDSLIIDSPAITEFSNPVLLDSSATVIFPLNNPVNSDENGGSLKSRPDATYWNIAFFNSATNNYHLLGRQKMIITQYEEQTELAGSSGNLSPSSTPDELDFKEPPFQTDGKLICYNVIISDFNKDGKLAFDDPKYLFISDKEGNNFRQVSPNNLNVISWQRIPKTNKLLIETDADTNNDKVFNEKDNTVPYIYDIKTGKPAEPVFSNKFNLETSKLYEQLWSAGK